MYLLWYIFCSTSLCYHSGVIHFTFIVVIYYYVWCDMELLFFGLSYNYTMQKLAFTFLFRWLPSMHAWTSSS